MKKILSFVFGLTALAATAGAASLTVTREGDTLGVAVTEEMVENLDGLYLVWDSVDRGENVLSWANSLQYDGEITAAGTYNLSKASVPEGSVYRVIATSNIQLIDGYIALTGSQCMDTGIDVASLNGLEVKFRVTGYKAANNLAHLLGGKNETFDVRRRGENTKIGLRLRAGNTIDISGISTNTAHVLSIRDTVVAMDGIQKHTVGGKYLTSASASLILGDAWKADATGKNGGHLYAEWYSVNLYSTNNLELVASFVPALTNGLPTMYETVSGTFIAREGEPEEGASEYAGTVTNIVPVACTTAFGGKRAVWKGTGDSADVTDAANWTIYRDGVVVAGALPDADTIVIVSNLNFDVSGATTFDFAKLYLEDCTLSQDRDLSGLKATAEIVELDFIDAPPGSYIDTGFIPKGSTHVRMDVTVRGTNENWFGAWNNHGSGFPNNYAETVRAKFVMCNDGNQGGIYFGFYALGQTSSKSCPAIGSGLKSTDGYGPYEFGRYIVDVNKNVGTIESVSSGKVIFNISRESNTTWATLNYNLYLFAINDGEGGTAHVRDTQGDIRFHGCKIWDDDTLVRDYVPARRVNADGSWTHGVYDKVACAFVEKSGDGAPFKGGSGSAVVKTVSLDIDLAGHDLTLPSAVDALGGRITDSVGGGAVRVSIPADACSKNDALTLDGALKLVKEGAGTFVAAKPGQTYTGGTQATGGILMPGTLATPWGPVKSLVTVNDGAAFDWGGYVSPDSSAYSFAIAGSGPDGNGALVNSVFYGKGNWYNSNVIADLTMLDDATIGGYGYFGFRNYEDDELAADKGAYSHTITMNDHTLTINMKGDSGADAIGAYGNNVCVFCCVRTVGGGTIAYNTIGDVATRPSFSVGKSDLSSVTFILDAKSDIYDRMPVTFGSFVNYSEKIPTQLDSKFTVLDTYKPMTTNLVMNFELGDAVHLSPVLDLSGLTGPYTLPASRYTLSVADGATVSLVLGDRAGSLTTPFISWSSKPDWVDKDRFVRGDDDRRFTFSVREDGLYAWEPFIMILR